MVTREDVIYAYRLLLGRDPESEGAIEGHLASSDWTALRSQFINSPEFATAIRQWRLDKHDPAAKMLAAPRRVDVEISDEQFADLLRNVQSTWEALGIEKPYWSVLTNSPFLPDRIKANLGQFYESGAQSWQFLECAAARGDKVLPADWTVFELGCGVGRVTTHLAKRFQHVVACDVSAPHLALARAYITDSAVGNVTLFQLKDLDALAMVDEFDLFYSIIVLQHNPPPLIYRMLEILLEKVRPGGCAYFQVPVALENYEFSITEYLNRDRSAVAMETHLLPQKYLFRVLDQHRLRILDLQQDLWQPPPFASLSILAEKG